MTRGGFLVVATTNARLVGRELSRDVQRQIPFATALALTRMAQVSQRTERRRMRKVFVIRRKWVVNQLKIRRANKRDWPNVHSIVGHTQEWMVDHEVGKVRRPRGRWLAIPTRMVRSGRSRRGNIPRSRKPQALRGDPRVVEVKDEGGPLLLRQYKRRSKSRSHLRETWYLLRPRARIRPRWGFGKAVQGYASRAYARQFRRALDFALRTARPSR